MAPYILKSTWIPDPSVTRRRNTATQTEEDTNQLEAVIENREIRDNGVQATVSTEDTKNYNTNSTKTQGSVNGKGCIEWSGTKKGKSGYGIQVVKWPQGEKKREAAHRVAYMIRHKLTRYDMPRVDENNNTIECSHICHNASCVNVNHLVLEPHAINLDRLHCKNQGLCSKSHKPYCLI
ncbi:unnamed protein product [Mytilus edulis]|uniref:Zinc-binding loop region of homing endonuclease domain-containing protein n=1 Tax=Mytilus edulis TaxID=6550 RepID=A0A8S3PYC2_MYTED|nr:unnamed protein product [Mytilus edulis]